MDVLLAFSIITAIILIGYLAELLFKKTKIPDVVILMLIGIFLRHGVGWVTPADIGEGATLFATFALVYLLFQGALAIDFKTLFSTLRGATAMSLLSFILTTAVISGSAMLFFRFDFMTSLLFGVILGGTSSAVVIPLVGMLPLEKDHKSTLMLESAISDVLCIVGALTIVNIIKTGQLDGVQVFNSILTSFALAMVVGAVVGLIWIHLMFKSKDLRESYMVTIAVVIGLYALIESQLVGASGAIGALAFGLVLGNSKDILSLTKRTESDKNIVKSSVLTWSAHSFFAEISFFVKVFFFVYLGILMDFTDPIVFVFAFAIVLAVYVVRPFSVWITHRKQNLSDITRTSLEVLIPKGLAAAVLVQLTIQKGVPNAELMSRPVLAIILLSVIFTSVLVVLSNKGIFKGFWHMRKKKELQVPPPPSKLLP